MPRILDLYGGSGAIALGLCAAGAEVHLVESKHLALLREPYVRSLAQKLSLCLERARAESDDSVCLSAGSGGALSSSPQAVAASASYFRYENQQGLE